jgi:ATP-dependent Clp protease protease subunit
MKKMIKHSVTNGTNEDMIDAVLEQMPPPFQLYTSTTEQVDYWFYLSTQIGAPCLYTDMIHTIRSAGPSSVIYLCINTPGGRLDTGIQLINAIKSSNATVVGVLDAEASSMGSILLLAADEYIIHDNCRMMFHDFSGGTSNGKGNEQIKELTAAIQLYNKLLKSICVPFLSTDEVERIIKGEDFWMDSDQIRERLTKISEMSNELIEEVPLKQSSRVKKSKADPVVEG